MTERDIRKIVREEIAAAASEEREAARFLGRPRPPRDELVWINGRPKSDTARSWWPVGVGEWRPERNGSFGRFHVASQKEAR